MSQQQPQPTEHQCYVCYEMRTNIRITRCRHFVCDECYNMWYVQMNQHRCHLCNSHVNQGEVIRYQN